MKKVFLTLPILFLTVIIPVVHPVFASTLDVRLTQEVGRLTTVATKAADRQNTQLQNIITHADTMIAARLTSLNTLLSRVQNDTRLSDTEKTTLTGNIDTMITNLQALKTKIDADTDVTTARADRKSIVTSYHVFITFEPQTRLLTIVNNLQTTTTNIQNLISKLQTLSSTLKSEGKDTTAIDNAIADMNKQLSNIQTLLTNDVTTLQSVVLTNNTYQSAFTGVRQDLAKVRADFAQIRHDMATIISSVHQMGVVKPTLTPTLTATPTP